MSSYPSSDGTTLITVTSKLVTFFFCPPSQAILRITWSVTHVKILDKLLKMFAHIVGYGYTKPAVKSGLKVSDMVLNSINLSFQSVKEKHGSIVSLSHLDGLIAMPSLG